MNNRLLVAMVIGLLLFPAGVLAEEPRETLKTTVEGALDDIRETDMSDTEEINALREQLVKTFEPLFHFRELAQRSLGPPARDLSADELDEFTRVYRTFLERLYVDRLVTVQEEAEEPYRIRSVEFGEQETRGNFARVPSTITVEQGTEVQSFRVNYRMVERDGRWGIYDLEIEDMSLVNTYRTQFTEFLNRNSIDELIADLRERVEQDEFADDLTPFDDD